MKHARKFPYFCIWTIVSLCFLPTWFAAPAIAGSPGCFRYDAESKNIFWFALISDTHIDSLQYRDKENLRAFLGVTLETVNPSFVVNLGDLTDQLLDAGSLGQRQWDDYREALSSNSAIDYFTYFDTPGNHDQYWESQNPWPEVSEAYDSLECRALSLFYPQGWPRFAQPPLTFYRENSLQGERFNRTQRSWVHRTAFGGVYHFLSISTPHPDFCHPCLDGYYDSPGGLDSEELRFIGEELESWKYAHLTFIFGHHPEYSLDEGRMEFRSLLKDYNVSVYGYGHTHEGGETALEGTILMNVDSLAESAGYALVAVDNGGVSLVHARMQEWPVVLITTPLDKALGGNNPYARPLPRGTSGVIRALVFDPEEVKRVLYRVDGGEWRPLAFVRALGGGHSSLWETTRWNSSGLSPGDHTLEVQAEGSALGQQCITVEIREMDGEQTRYVYIDDLDTGFTRYGRPESWISVNDSQEGTYKRHAYLMVTSALSGETFAQWRPRLPAEGNYEVFAYIPRPKGPYPFAPFVRYHVQYKGGIREVIADHKRFDQEFQGADRWFSLGVYPFKAGTSGLVEVSGRFSGRSETIGCDALRFVRTTANSSRTDLTGWWYNPVEAGAGFSIEVQKGKLFLAWCTYDEQSGRALWYGSGGPMTDEKTFSGELLSWKGWPLGGPYIQPEGFPVGSVEIAFLSLDQAHLTWTLGGSQGEGYLVRFMEDVSPGDRDPRALHGWWFSPAFPGMGVFVESQGGTLFLAWYHYGEDGTSRWWSAGRSFSPGSSVFSSIFEEWRNGSCPGCPYRPLAPPYNRGAVAVRFEGESQAAMEWEGGRIHLEKLNLAALP
jgi:hypothetical protein